MYTAQAGAGSAGQFADQERRILFLTGMAQGVDQWAAEIVLAMKRSYPHIQLIAVLPCETQANKWSQEQRERYFNTLAVCDDVITLNARYTPQCMLERNRYMVDHAGYLLAVYDGGEKAVRPIPSAMRGRKSVRSSPFIRIRWKPFPVWILRRWSGESSFGFFRGNCRTHNARRRDTLTSVPPFSIAGA